MYSVLSKQTKQCDSLRKANEKTNPRCIYARATPRGGTRTPLCLRVLAVLLLLRLLLLATAVAHLLPTLPHPAVLLLLLRPLLLRLLLAHRTACAQRRAQAGRRGG